MRFFRRSGVAGRGRARAGGGRGWQVDDCAGQGLHSLSPAVLRLNAFVFSHSKAQREREGETDVCAHARKRRVHNGRCWHMSRVAAGAPLLHSIPEACGNEILNLSPEMRSVLNILPPLIFRALIYSWGR